MSGSENNDSHGATPSPRSSWSIPQVSSFDKGAVLSPAGWLDDPTGAFKYRYWDGRDWTEHVSDGDGVVSSDPLTPPPSPPRKSTQISTWALATFLVLFGMLGSVVWIWSLPSHKEMLGGEEVFNISLEGMVDSVDKGIVGSCSHFQLFNAPREIKRVAYIEFAEGDSHLRRSSAGELVEKVEDAGWVLSSGGPHSGRWVFAKKIGSWRKGYEGRLDVYFDPVDPIVVFVSKSDCESSPSWFVFPRIYFLAALALVVAMWCRNYYRSGKSETKTGMGSG